MYVSVIKTQCTFKVTLVWIFGYQGILTNEEADRLAKEGANKDRIAQVIGVIFPAGKEVFRSDLRQDHLTRGVACHDCRQSKC
jgi:Ribonuclease HI